MTRYPVRCCCNPLQLLGYLDLHREGLCDGATAIVYERYMPPAASFFSLDPDAKPFVMLGGRRHQIELRRIRGLDQTDKFIDEIAVYSDDRPIEFWRKIHGFSEMRGQPFTFHTVDPRMVDLCRRHKDAKREVMLNIDGREVIGAIREIKLTAHTGITDITIEEMVPVI
jgi:hypothetical protein